MGKIFDALEKFSKESGVPRSNKIKNSDYGVLMHFDESTGKLDIHNPEFLKDARGIKRLMTYRLINENGTLTPAGRAKYEEMTKKTKIKQTIDKAQTDENLDSLKKKQEDV